MSQTTAAGRILADLHKDSPTLWATVVAAAAVAQDRAEGAMARGERLTLSEQLRLAEAVTELAPVYQRQAGRLRAQTLAARSYESGEVQVHSGLPAERWERSASLRR